MRERSRLCAVIALGGLTLLAGCSTARPTTTTSTTTTAPATTTPKEVTCVAKTKAWPLSQLLEQLLMVIGQYTDLGALSAEAAGGVGGFVLLGEPPASETSTVRAGLADLAGSASGAGQVVPWMSTDTEGGPVSRLADVLGPIPSARQMAAEWSTGQTEQTMASRGAAMRSLGITMDLAPVLDTASPTDSVADESQRSFSGTPQVAASYGVAFAAGLRSAGVVAVGKHFPGLGHADADTDTGPATDPPLSELRSDDLIPFERAIAAGLPVIMVGHPIVPGLTGGLPASLSPATYALLRTTLRFNGVAMTDSLGAGAISSAGYTQSSAAVTAIVAGADMAMIDAATWQSTLAALEHAVADGSLSRSRVDASVDRILATKGICSA